MYNSQVKGPPVRKTIQEKTYWKKPSQINVGYRLEHMVVVKQEKLSTINLCRGPFRCILMGIKTTEGVAMTYHMPPVLSCEHLHAPITAENKADRE